MCLGTLALTFAATVSSPSGADAQGSCTTSTPEVTVSDERDLDVAIRCYNEQSPPGDHTITIDRQLFLNPTHEPITQPDPAHTLIIDGGGLRHEHFWFFPDTPPAPIFTVTGQGQVQFRNLVIDLIGNIALETTGDAGTVHLTDSRLSGSLLINGGKVTVRQSTIFDDRTFMVERPASIVVGETGSVALSNTTLSNTSLQATGTGMTTVSNSTLISRLGAPVTGNGTVAVESSIVVGPDQACEQSVAIIDRGSNFGSHDDCGSGFIVMTAAEQELFGPTTPGCLVVDCPPLHPLLIGNPAIDAGNCIGVTLFVGEIGDLTIDGRASERPQGPECDAGSYEWANPCSSSTEVLSPEQLDEAIECFNFQVPDGSHTISLGAPISYSRAVGAVTLNNPNLSLTINGRGEELNTRSGIFRNSAFFKVEGDSPVRFEDILLRPDATVVVRATGQDSQLEFEGSRVEGEIDGGSGSVLVSDSSVLDARLTAVTGKTVSIVASRIADSGGTGVAMSGGSLTVSGSVIVDNRLTGVVASNSDVLLANSVIAGNGTAIMAVNGATDIVSSIVTDHSSTALDVRSANGGNSQLAIWNSEISFNGIAVEFQGDELWASNSTFFDNNVALWIHDRPAELSNSTFFANEVAVDGAQNTTVTSSILLNFRGTRISSCPAPIAGSANFALDTGCGDAFEPIATAELSTFGTFDEHGCDQSLATAWGCPRTIALLVGNPALDRGLCQDVPVYLGQVGDLTTDQRGFDRIATDCDAGAFEASQKTCNGRFVTIDMSTGAPGIGTEGPDVILGTDGDDTIRGLGGDDALCGGAGNDNIEGNDGNDRIAGGPGRDVLRGGPGTDELSGDDGDDRVLGGIGDDIMDGGPGNDFLGGFGGADTITGGPGNDTIYGGFGADVISGGGGADTIFGLIGDDTISGGTGSDVLNGDRGNDTMTGDGGDDTLNGGNANDDLRGNSGDDVLNGGKADDTLHGGPGADTCTGNKQNNADTADDSCETQFGIP